MTNLLKRVLGVPPYTPPSGPNLWVAPDGEIYQPLGTAFRIIHDGAMRLEIFTANGWTRAKVWARDYDHYWDRWLDTGKWRDLYGSLANSTEDYKKIGCGLTGKRYNPTVIYSRGHDESNNQVAEQDGNNKNRADQGEEVSRG